MTTGIRAVYFPYARSLDPTFLKHALFLFDHLVFVDPLERAIRESIGYYDARTGLSGHAQWDSMKEDYAFLEEEGVFKRLNPFPVVRDYDGLMAQAVLCDLRDQRFMQLASTFASKDYWGILRGKIPPDSLLASAITWGSLLGMMPDPLLSSQFSPHRIRFWRNPTNVSSPREEGREYGGFHDSSSPFIMSVAHDYIPVSCGYSVNTNLALLLAQLHDVVPVTDDPAAVQLLNLKYLRAKGAAHPEAGEISGGSVIARRTPEYFRKYNIVGVNVVEALVPHDDMTQRSFKEILDFRQAERESFERFQTYLRELVAQIESEPWSASLETEVIRMLDSKVIPASVKIRDEMTSAYEKMFGGVIKKTAATVTPTLAASVFSGLSPGQVLTLSCAAVAGALSISLPDLTDLWQEGRQNKRNGLSFLVRFASG